MFYRTLTIFTVRYARPIIAAWLCILIVTGVLAVRLTSVLSDHGVKVEDGAYAKVQQLLHDTFRLPSDPVIILFEKPHSISKTQFRNEISLTIQRLQHLPGIGQILSPLDQPGMVQEQIAYAVIPITAEKSDIPPTIQRLRNAIPNHLAISATLTGKHVVQEDVNQSSQRDLMKAEAIGLPVAFLILWLAFGGFFLALLPILAGLLAVVGAMGVMAILGTKMELSIFTLNVIPMVGLALSLDFALILVSRFREELRRRPMMQALAHTLSTAGRAILFSALCVAFAISGVLWIDMPIFTSIAASGLVVLTFSVLITLTLVPALLSLTASKMMPAANDSDSANPKRSSAWLAIAHFVMQRPIRLCLLASLILVSCIMPLASMRIAVPDHTSLPRSYESRAGAERFSKAFLGPNTSQAHIIAEIPAGLMQRKDWERLGQIHARLSRDPGVVKVDSVFSLFTPEQLYAVRQSPELNRKYRPVTAPFLSANHVRFAVTLRGDAASDQAKQWVRSWERQHPDLLVGGEPKFQQEAQDEIANHLYSVLLFIFISNFLVLFVAFRSILIPIKTILMNLLSLGASFGILVWIFEGGRFGIEQTSIALMIPVFIFGLTFGISMDYGVFLLSRIYESYRLTGNNDQAVGEGLASSSKIITSAAAIMVAVTAPFAMADVSGIQQLGIGIASAILIDATIVRILLVPSLMKLLGKWNWWAP